MTARCLAGSAPTARHRSRASSRCSIRWNWSSEQGRSASAISAGSSSRLCVPRLRAARATSRLRSIVARSSHALRCSPEANASPLRAMRRTSATNTSWKTSSASARLRVCASARRQTAPPCSRTMRSNASPCLPPPTSRPCGGAPAPLVSCVTPRCLGGIDSSVHRLPCASGRPPDWPITPLYARPSSLSHATSSRILVSASSCPPSARHSRSARAQMGNPVGIHRKEWRCRV